ncbi:hypothetical protein MIR68_001493 [Amoeboaphelidium protococcarum]|nr:hypothetical protein MIR68_001493 [Amoeboaphelidium protococcarum]
MSQDFDQLDSVIANFVVPSGTDCDSRPTVAVYANLIPASTLVDHKHLLSRLTDIINSPYIISTNAVVQSINHTVHSDYTLILFASPCTNKPSWTALFKTYNQIQRHARKNLKSLVVVHPATWFRWVMDAVKMVVSPKFAKKLLYFKSLAEFEQAGIIRFSQLQISMDIRDHDDSIRDGASSGSQKNSTLQQKQQVVVTKNIFGANLNTIMGDGDIPLPIREAVQYIQKNGLDTEGVFRRSPNSAHLKKVKASYEGGQSGINFDDYDMPVHLAAVLIKVYLKDLPQPVFSSDLHSTLQESVSDQQNLTIDAIISVINQLEENEMLLLAFTAKLLHIIAIKHSEQTKMNASNLSIVFAPNLVRCDGNVGLEMELSRCVSLLLQQWINNYDQITRKLSLDQSKLQQQLQLVGI